MKTYKSIPLIILVFFSCQRQEATLPPEREPGTDPVPMLVEHTLYASTPLEDASQVRTQVSLENEKKILWSAHESISILSGGGNYPFVGANDLPAADARFTGEGPADLGNYIALYPYNASASYDGDYVSTSLPAIQTGRKSSFADGYLVTADDATGSSISFNHVCSGIRFMVTNRNDISAVSIRGNNGEKIAGDFRFRFTAEDTPVAESGTEQCVTLRAPGGHFEIGEAYYIVILPTEFSKGFTLIADNGSQIGELRFDNSVTFSPGRFKNVTGGLDRRMTWAASKVYYGPQNSFCLRPGRSVSFDVSPRLIEGSWQRGSVPAIADAPDGTEVLWGNSTASLSGSTLTLTAAATEGSSLVAIKKGETILWSYLIWVTAEAPAETTFPSGAVIQSTLGGECYFQWGRKDPLVAGCPVIAHPGDANALSTSIRNPESCIHYGTNCQDWYAAEYFEHQDATLWGGTDGSKTVWDPCPEGWRVPKVSDFIVGDELEVSYANSFDKFGSISPGDDVASHNYDYTWDAYCWTREPSGYYANYFGMVSDEVSISFESSSSARYLGLSVRCVKE